MSYEFVIRNEKERTYRLIRHILILLNVLGLFALMVNSPLTFTNFIAPVFAVVLSGFYLAIVFIERLAKKPGIDTIHRLAFGLSAVAWLRSDYWWFSIPLIVFLVLDIFIHRQLVISVTGEFVQLPTVPRKKLAWKELSNVILKDGIITVDTRSNYIFQHAILEDDIDENDFNQFCNKQLST